MTQTVEEEACPSGDGTRMKYAFSHSWQEMYDALVSNTPVYIKATEQHEGTSFVMLNPVASAFNRNNNEYLINTAAQAVQKIVFLSATDKVFYVGDCGR